MPATVCGMGFAAVDVQYLPDGGARAALVLAADRRFATLVAERVAHLVRVAPYRPGAFFERELPALAAVLDGAGADELELLVVDGYVDLDPAGRPGLGAHAHARFGVPVVGVAKTAFRGATHAVPVRRGGAAKPLYVTAAGIPLAEAATLVAEMAGPYRLPDALRRVDALARGHVAAQLPAHRPTARDGRSVNGATHTGCFNASGE
jgi:deoxyribonuclease V